MSHLPKIIISASRRTDIPAFYMNWFMDQIKAGFFTIENPYNKIKKSIDATCSNVHSIIFWSKNFESFLTMKAGETLLDMGYHLYFNFTINSESLHLEPHVPPLNERLLQLEKITDIFGPEAISWRFDPICFYEFDNPKTVTNNLSGFSQIAKKAGTLGIRKCVTSFFDSYKKIDKRLQWASKKGKPNIKFIVLDLKKKIEIIERMQTYLAELDMNLHLCCEKETLSQLRPGSSAQANACIDGVLLNKLFDGNPMQTRDYGQRSQKGCKCTKSIDVGSYNDHPCHHNCIFCYANPQMDEDIQTNKCH